MNREIKFRAWQDNQMLYSNGGGVNRTKAFLDRLYEDCELMQFTGLFDKNGKEIYSDDILYDENIDIKFRVYSTYGGFVIKAPYWAAQNMNNLILGDDLITESLSNAQVGSWIKQSCKIIGNIYENPELLK